MNKIRLLLGALVAMTAMNTSAIEENIKIQGDHGQLDAIVQTPLLNSGQKVPMVILCHGFMGNKDNTLFEGLCDSLEKRGIASIRFDFNGHGKSEGKFEDMSVPNEITDAEKVFEYARKLPFVEKIGIAGHSQGGVVTAMVAGQLGSKDVAAIALMAPAAVLRDDALRGNTFGKMYDPYNPPADGVEMFAGKRLGANYIRTAIELPIYETAMKYEGPTYIIHGNYDRVVPYTYGQRFQEQMHHAEFHLMNGMDHGFSKHEAEIDHLVAEFFKRVFDTEESNRNADTSHHSDSKTQGETTSFKKDGVATLFKSKKPKVYKAAPSEAENLGGGYARDSKHAYYNGKIIGDAQGGKNFIYKGDGYATDGIHHYLNGKPVDRD